MSICSVLYIIPDIARIQYIMATHVNHGPSRWVTTTWLQLQLSCQLSPQAFPSIPFTKTMQVIEQNTIEDLRTGLLETYGSIIFIFWSL